MDQPGKLSVLVVDDTDHVRNMLGDMLELDGFTVVGRASSGKQAISMIDEVDPNVVVMDYKMPTMDGLTASRAIKEKRPSQQIILYTAYLDEHLEEEAKKAGIAICLGKVEGLNLLERHIVELCRDLQLDA